MYKPTKEDMELPFQSYIEAKIKIELLDINFKTIATLQDALISDSYSVDADSDIRRTYEGVFYVKDPSFFIGESRKIWTDKYIRVWKGRKSNKTGQILWYNIGIYLFNDTSYTYNETTKQLTITCVDLMSKLNNTFSGQITGAFTFQIPCEQTVTEEVIKHGEVQRVKSGETVINTRVSIGTAFSLSLISPHIQNFKYYKLLKIELHIAGVHIYDTNWQTVTTETAKLRLSIDDVVLKSDVNEQNVCVFNIDLSKENKMLSIGFLQNISLTKINVYFKYVETEDPNASEVIYMDNFTESILWHFWDTENYKNCLLTDYIGIGNETQTLKQDVSNSLKYNTLTIDTSERAVSDTVTKPTSWYNTVIDTIENLGGIKDYIVEYTDAVIPYDLEFQTGTSVYDILKELANLMVNWEMFFDVDGVLRIEPIPTLYEDDIILDSEYLKPLIISETNKDSFSKIRNITEVWGMTIDASYYTDVCRTISNGYEAEFSDLVFTDEVKISNNTIIGIKINSENIENPCITVRANKIDVTTESSERVSTEPITVYTSSGDILEAGTLKPNISYCFKYYKGKFYYMGQFQVHGMCIETEKEPTGEEKEVNKEKYNCQNIYYSVEPNSPYCVEKIGERIQVLSGDDYENIYSDELAVERAKWENWKTTRRQETISLEMIDIPWLDVNCKIEYKSYIDGETHQYIVKSINSSTSEGTMTVELMRFYPLYLLDAKKYEAVISLKDYKENLLETYLYSNDSLSLLQKYLKNGASEIYSADNTDDIKTIFVGYKNRMDSVEKI